MKLFNDILLNNITNLYEKNKTLLYNTLIVNYIKILIIFTNNFIKFN
jgi:hypothetical protein